ncbi:MAG: thioredoxin domain-containing protein, partial [Acidiphilium sp. 34-60-192]
KFYVWTRREIESVLGEDLASFEAHYPCPEGGNWEERIILTRATHPEDAATEAQLAGLRARLLAARDRRVRPGRDDKILADWNGLAIAALVRASAVFERPDWLAAAWSAYRAVEACLGGADGRFGHAFRRGRISAIGLLDDQAAMLRAMLSLYQASGDVGLLEAVRRGIAVTEARFGDGRGGFYLVADDAADLPGGMRPHGGFDGVTPAGAGLMVEVYATLYLLTGTGAHRERAEQIIATMSGERRILSAYPTMLVAARMLEVGGCVVIIGDPARADFRALHQAALRGFDPALVVLPVGDASGLAPTHPAYGKMPGADGQAAAYLCRAQSCAPPVFRAEDLAALIVQPGGRRNS